MNRKNGFTLLELLIVATLLSILAAFAIGSYRTSVREARLTDLKNQARAAAYAIEQYKEEYPKTTFDREISIEQAIDATDKNGKLRFPNLASFVNGTIIGHESWEIYLCNRSTAGIENAKGPCSSAPRNFQPLVCLTQKAGGQDPNFDDSYVSGCYAFCISETGEHEKHLSKCDLGEVGVLDPIEWVEIAR